MMTPAQERLSARDPVLASLISTLPVPTIASTNSVFFDLMSCCIEQQIHYRSTKKVFQKLLEKSGISVLTPENFIDFERKALAAFPLSLRKYETLLRVLDFWDKNEIDWSSLLDAEVRKKLSSIKGIGPWTIDMILLYTLQRPRVFPSDDFHLKQSMTRLYGLNPSARLKSQMLEISAAWGEHQSLAVLYLFSWKEHTKKSALL